MQTTDYPKWKHSEWFQKFVELRSAGDYNHEIAEKCGVDLEIVKSAWKQLRANGIDVPKRGSAFRDASGEVMEFGDDPDDDISQPGFSYKNETPDDLTLDEFIHLAELNQKATESVDPLFVTEEMEPPRQSKNRPIGICFVSCLHLGSRFVNHGAFRSMLDEILDIPNLFWFSLGDEVEGMQGFFDVGSAHEQALADPKLQRKMLSLILDKIASKGKLMCGFQSQHGGEWEDRKRGEDPIKRMYMERNIRYFDGQAYIKMAVGNQMYRIFAAHELPGNSMHNKNHAQKRAATQKAPQADMVVMGDKHSYAVQRESVDTFEWMIGDRPWPYRYLVQVGTSKTGLDPYTIKSWSPGVWNWPTFVFRHDRHEIVEAADLNIARYMLNDWK